jgi:hypothetical protein
MVCTAGTRGIQLFPRSLPGEKIALVHAAAAVKGTMDGSKFQWSVPHKRTCYPRWNLGQAPRASGVHRTLDLLAWTCVAKSSKLRSTILDEEYGF